MGMKSSVIRGFSTPSVLWKTGTPGNPFVDGDTVNPNHGDIVMIDVVSGDGLTINLPEITEASAGRILTVINLTAIKQSAGDVTLVATVGNTVEAINPEDDFVSPDVLSSKLHFYLMSDGVDRWSFFYPDSGRDDLVPA